MPEPSESPQMTALVLARESERGMFTVESLSDHGARLIGTLPLARGESISVLLEIGDRPVDVAGEVMHVEAIDGATRQVVVRFQAQSHAARQAISRLIVRMALGEPS